MPGLGPLTINLNIDAKTNGIDVNNILTEFIFYFQQEIKKIYKKKLQNSSIMATVSSIGPRNVFDWTKIKMIIYRIILK